jgi:hypothetical protein
MRSLFTIALCCLLASCGDYHGPPAYGKVLAVTNFEEPTDQWKFAPIQGAEDLVLWYGYKPGFAHGKSMCLKKLYAKSDADGWFRVGGWTMPKVVGGIEDIRPVTYAYVSGLVELRYQERWHPIWTRESPDDPEVHVFRRVEDPSNPDDRSNAFVNARFCPSEEFAEANKRLQPIGRENAPSG